MQIDGRILSNCCVAENIWQMEVYAPELAQLSQPGQFVNVRVGDSVAPLLRRPISFHGIDPERGVITLLMLVVGEGTERLSRLEAGQTIDLVGPLGHGFSLNFEGERALLVAGGIGVAPLAPLISALQMRGKTVKLLQGAKTASALVAMDCERAVATDDGSCGERGLVTSLLERELSMGNWDFVYVCGPKPMLRVAESIALAHGVAGEISAEERMGCGLGVCLSCSARSRDGKNLRVCTDGPVFGIGVLNYDE